MILKALKILPFMTSALNTPVFNTPKKANDNTPTLIYGNSLPNGNAIVRYRDYMDEDETIKRSSTYKTTELQETNFGNFIGKSFAEDYYLEQNNSVYIYLNRDNNGSTHYHSYYLQSFELYSINGYNQIYLELYQKYNPSQLSHGISNLPLTIKQTAYVCLTNKGLEYFNIDIESSSLYYMINQLKNDYHVQKIQENINNFNNISSQTNISLTYEIPEDNYYNVNEGNSQTYYFFLLTETYSETEVYKATIYTDEELYETSYKPTTNFAYIEYYNQSPRVVQEIVDIPNLMFTVLTMPFSFYSQAFNLTLFPGTQYSFNIGNFLLCLLAILLFAWILKIIIGFAKK